MRPCDRYESVDRTNRVSNGHHHAPAGIRGRDILRVIASSHNLSVDALWAPGQDKRIVAARIEAVAALKSAGLPVSIIARLCKRERTTILYYADSSIRQRKKIRNQALRARSRASA